MLLGMRYCDGNGDPFYYREDGSGLPEPGSFIEVDTLKGFATVDHDQTLERLRWSLKDG